MIALLWMVSPIWEAVIAPVVLITVGYWARPRVEEWLDRLDEHCPDTATRDYPRTSHVRALPVPYDWANEEDE